MSATTRTSLFRAKMAQHILQKAKGFTLIELLVVIVIVGVLSAVAIPTFLNQIRRSRVAEAQAGLDGITRGADVYRFDNGQFPGTGTSAYGLLAGDTNNGGLSTNEGKYIDGPFANTAPNFGDPSQIVTQTTATTDGISQASIWATRSQASLAQAATSGVPSSAKAYKAKGGQDIVCAVGQGVYKDLTKFTGDTNLTTVDLAQACNINLTTVITALNAQTVATARTTKFN